MVFLSLMLTGLPSGSVFGQTITIDPSAPGKPISSHIIGAVRNHTNFQAESLNGAIGSFGGKMGEYAGIKPRFGKKRKLYRLGGSPIDGIGSYEGYYAPTANYGTGSNLPQNAADSYPYDDISYFIKEAKALDADIIVGVNVGSGSPEKALKYIEEVLGKASIDDIAYFELGNELYGFWQVGHNMYGCSPEAYRIRAAQFIDYFKANMDASIFNQLNFALMGSYSGSWSIFANTGSIVQNPMDNTKYSVTLNWSPPSPTYTWSPVPDFGQGTVNATYNTTPGEIQVEIRQNNGILVDILSTTQNCNGNSPQGVENIVNSYIAPDSPLMDGGTPKFQYIAFHNYANGWEFAQESYCGPKVTIEKNPNASNCEIYAGISNIEFNEGLDDISFMMTVGNNPATGGWYSDQSWSGTYGDQQNHTLAFNGSNEVSFNVFDNANNNCFVSITLFKPFLRKEAYLQVAAVGTAYRGNLQTANDLLSGLGVKLTNTEYGSINIIGQSPLAHSISEGLFAAENMMDAIRYDVDGATAFSLFHAWGDQADNLFFKQGDAIVKYPVFYVQKLIAENTGKDVIPSTTSDSPFKDVVMCQGDDVKIDYLETVVTKDDDGTLYLLMLDKEPPSPTSGPMFVKLTGIDYCDYEGTLLSYTGNDLLDAPTEFITTNNVDLSSIKLDPLSVNVLKLTPVTPFDLTISVDINCGVASFKGPQGNPSDFTYLWSFGDNTNSTELNPQHTYNTTVTQTFNVSLTISNPNGCSKDVYKDVKIVVNPINASFTLINDCPNSPTITISGPTGNPTNVTYAWIFGDGTTSTAQNPTHTYTADGDYSVELTVTDECGNAEPKTIQVVNINCIVQNLCSGANKNLTLPSGTSYWTQQNWQDEPIGTLTVPANATLIIEAGEVLRFANGGILNILERGRVILYGTLTSCGDYWQGVRALSTNKPSYFIGRNGSEISNAVTGISSTSGTRVNINCKGVTFIDNGVSIKMEGKHSVGYFQLCHFLYTKEYSSPYNVDYAHVVIKDMNSAKRLNRGFFRGCEFKDNKNKHQTFGILNSGGVAIVSDYCPYIVQYPFSCDAKDVTQSEFKKMYRGIADFGGIVNCSKSVFESCVTGIQCSNSLTISVTENQFNEFDIPLPYSKDDVKGLYVAGQTIGINCRYNHFEGETLEDDNETAGIHVRSLGSFSNVIERNDFKYLDFGNRAGVGNANGDIGLNYLCNTNSNNKVHDFEAKSVRNGIGLYDNFNNTWSPARNTFTHLSAPNTSGSDFRYTAGVIDYHYWTAVPVDEPIDVIGVNKIGHDESSTPCQDKKGPCKYCLTPEERDINRNMYFFHDTELQKSKEQFDALTLAGKANEASEVKLALAYHQQERDFAAEKGYASALLDTITYDQDTVRLWLRRFKNPTGDYRLVMDYIKSNEYVSAQRILTSIPTKYEMDSEEWSDFVIMEGIYDAVMEDGLSSLTPTTIDYLIEIAESEKGQACYLAREVLSYYDFIFPPILDESVENNSVEGNPTPNLKKMHISPNPTDYYVQFDWSSFDVVGDVLIEITSSTGGLIDVLRPVSGNKTIDWTTEKVSGNICHYRLIINGKEVDSGQIVINK